ncbi:MAG TPA: hypothetical protein VGF77_16770 [Allosphingosinicella sp.]
MDWRLLGQVALIPGLDLLRRGQVGLAVTTIVRNGHALLRDGLVPSEARLFADARAALRARRAGLYLQREHRRHLRRFRTAISAHGLRCKVDFARFCAGAGLSHPPTLVIEPDREPGAMSEIGDMAGESFFVKPAMGGRSRGAAVVHRLRAGRWQLVAPDRALEGDLMSLLKDHLPEERLVVQPLLVNAPPLAQWAGEMLAIFRIVTARATDGTVRTLSMLAELPLEVREPLPARWAVFPVSLDRDELSSLDVLAAERMPAFAARAASFARRRIQAAGALRALAQAAHARLAAAASLQLAPTIGWDMAWTPEGPMLLEPNWNWAVAPHYRNAAGLDFELSARFEAAAREGD